MKIRLFRNPYSRSDDAQRCHILFLQYFGHYKKFPTLFFGFFFYSMQFFGINPLNELVVYKLANNNLVIR